MSVGKPMKFKTSEDSAAAFQKSFERRRRRLAAKRPTTNDVREPVRRVEVLPGDRDELAAAVREIRELTPSPRVAPPSRIGPDTLFVRVTVPIRTYNELLEHCVEFGLTPQDFIKQALAQAKLSRGGV